MDRNGPSSSAAASMAALAAAAAAGEGSNSNSVSAEGALPPHGGGEDKNPETLAAVGGASLSASPVAARRGAAGGGPSCQAERCAANLHEATRYYRRHKVCEPHSKAAVVLVAGLRQRFCQQCSRFHELLEFDDDKRSCRRRLAGHNERRRRSSADRHADQDGRGHQGSNPSRNHFHIR